MGVAYKPNINDPRKSPALEIIDIVAHKGGNVQYHDPFIAKATTPEERNYQSTELTAKVLAATDCLVLTTNHDEFDMEFVRSMRS